MSTFDEERFERWWKDRPTGIDLDKSIARQTFLAGAAAVWRKDVNCPRCKNTRLIHYDKRASRTKAGQGPGSVPCPFCCPIKHERRRRVST